MDDTSYPSSIYIAHNACKRRSLDASRLRAWFESKGARVTAKPGDAQVVVFVSCGFKESRIRHTVLSLKRLHRGGKRVIVTGCVPAVAPEALPLWAEYLPLESLDSIDALFAPAGAGLTSIPDANAELAEKIAPSLLEKGLGRFALTPRFLGQSARAIGRRIMRVFRPPVASLGPGPILRIARGCSQACSYCGLRLAIGSLESKSLDAILAEYRSFSRDATVVLTADDTGAWGLDIGTDLPALLRALETADRYPGRRWRIEELNPTWILRFRDELLAWVANGRITGMHIPIQSGSPRILAMMNRTTDAASVVEAIRAFRDAQGSLRLETHLIVGFPSETESDLKATVGDVIAAGFDRVDLFRYSEFPGTISCGMDPKVPVSAARRRILRAIRELERAGIVCVTDDA